MEVRVALGSHAVPTDIILSRPEEFAWRKEIVGTTEYPAAREGTVLYGRDPDRVNAVVAEWQCATPSPHPHPSSRHVRPWPSLAACAATYSGCCPEPPCGGGRSNGSIIGVGSQKPCSEPLLSLESALFNNCFSSLRPFSY